MQAEFNQTSGRLTFSHPDMPATLIERGVVRARYRRENGQLQQAELTGQGCSIHEGTVMDVHGTGRQVIIHCPTNPDGIELTYRINTYDQRPFLLLQLSLCNQSPESIYLHQLCLFQAASSAGGCVQLSKPNNSLRFFKVGWHGWYYAGLRNYDEHNTSSKLDFLTSLSYSNPTTPKPHARGEFWSEGWGILANELAAIVVGFVSTAHQFGQVYACAQPDQEALMLITQMDDVRLDPKESIDSELGYLQFVPLPNPEPAADFVEAVARHMQARLPASPPPPMWTHWYHFYHNISEQLFLQNLDALAEHRTDVPYQMVELDDGYQSAWGDWTITNARFPHGLEWLADQISYKGFTPGLWLAPFVVQGKSQVARQHPDWLLKNEQGHPIRAGFLYNMFIQALDASHPAVLEHLRDLTTTLTHEWGFSMLKVDFLYAGALPGRHYNPKLTRAEAFWAGLEAIRQGAGEDTFLLGCGCPFGPAIGVVDAMRIGPDTAPSWEPYFNWLPWAGPLIKTELSMPSLRNALRHTLNLSTLHKRWWWNDPDCLLVRDTETHLTEVEVQTAISLVGLSGGLLISSDDMRKLNPDRLHCVRLLVPNLGLRALPLDWLEHKVPKLYRVQLQESGQAPQTGGSGLDGQTGKGWQLVALVNWNSCLSDVTLRFEELGYGPGAMLHVFDFWSRQYWRVTDPEVEFSGIPAHGCKLLRVCEVGTTPQLIGDTLHISQGAEISSMRLEKGKLVLETVDMGRRVEGELWFWLSKAPQVATCNGEQVGVEEKEEGVYAVKVRFEGIGRVEVSL
jgi:alpha-galactosidase